MSNVVKQLAQLGRVCWLSRRLRGTDHSNAGQAAAGLARINTPRAIQALAESLRDDHEPIWNAALTALMQVGGEPAARVLLGAIPGVAPNVQTALIRALGELNPPDLAPRLLKLVRGKGGPEQHREAVRVIVKSDPIRAVNLFWEESAAPVDSGLRSEMEAAVRSLTNQDCIPALVAKLGRSPPRGNLILDKAMLSALVSFADAAVGPLSARVAETGGHQTESEGYARRRAIEALVRIGTSHVAEVLSPILSSIDVQVAIGRLSDAELATLRKEDWMERLLSDCRQHGPRAESLRILSQFRDPQAAE